MHRWRSVLRRARWAVPAVVVAIAVAIAGGIALGDNVTNDVTTTGDIVSVTAGGAGATVKYGIQATGTGGMPGCDATAASPAVVTPTGLPAGVTKSPPSVTFTACVAATSGLGVTFTADAATVPGDYLISVSVADAVGNYNLTNAEFTLRVAAAPVTDSTPPVIVPNVAGTLGDNGWYVSDVAVTWSVSDAQSTVSSSTGCGPTTIAADTSGVTLTCSATSAGGTASESVTIKRDATDPDLSPTVSPNPVLLNGGATASPNASDATSGLASASCDAVDTSSVGSKTVACTATDNAGNTANASASYSVIFDFRGFFQPVDNLPTLNAVKAGSAVPVKFSLGGDQGLAIMASGYPASKTIACSSTAPDDAVEQTSTAGGSSLQYDPPAGQYVYVWKTEKGWAGTCRQLVVKLVDGTLHQANFKLK